MSVKAHQCTELQLSPKKSNSSGGLWSKIKKSMNIKDTPSPFKRHSFESQRRKSKDSDVEFNRKKSLTMQDNGKLYLEVAEPRLRGKDSLRSAQLELAKHDRETNALNNKPTVKSAPKLGLQPGGIKVSQSTQSFRQYKLQKEAERRLRSSDDIRRAYTPGSIDSDRYSSVSTNYSARSQHSLANSRRSLQRTITPERPSRTVTPNSHYSMRSAHRGSVGNPPQVTPPPKNGNSLWGKVRDHYAPRATEHSGYGSSPACLRISQMWSLVCNAVVEGELIDESVDTHSANWWRKVFLCLGRIHGKAKANTIASQLMQNPEMLSAIRSKLDGLVDDHHNPQAHMLSLPACVRRRVNALKNLQLKMVELESEFYKEVHALECKYAKQYTPIHERRSQIVNGEVEPNDEECNWKHDDIPEEFDSALKIEDAAAQEEVKGIKGFWLQVFKNVEMLSAMVQDPDEPILEHLTDIKVSYSDQPMGFTLEFHFSANEYFTNTTLTKSYEMRAEPDESDPLSFEGPEIIACQGCVINWNKGKNVTVKLIKKKQKNQKSGTTRTITKTEQADSFFNFFSPPDAPGDDEEAEETEALLQADFEIGHYIRERVVPRAVLFYTGEACEDDDFDVDDDDDDDDMYDDDEDIDASQQPTGGKQDCKQQ